MDTFVRDISGMSSVGLLFHLLTNRKNTSSAGMSEELAVVAMKKDKDCILSCTELWQFWHQHGLYTRGGKQSKGYCMYRE
ncbi:MAG: hypothetical protein IJ801_10085 [Lachnospiraceae bacterium]|nr:hypothetical protein [Lachnospiraceae bacterium]